MGRGGPAGCSVRHLGEGRRTPGITTCARAAQAAKSLLSLGPLLRAHPSWPAAGAGGAGSRLPCMAFMISLLKCGGSVS